MKRRNPTDLHILRAFAETGSVASVAEVYDLTEMAVRHRLHRLYRKHEVHTAAEAVWKLRRDLERLVA